MKKIDRVSEQVWKKPRSSRESRISRLKIYREVNFDREKGDQIIRIFFFTSLGNVFKSKEDNQPHTYQVEVDIYKVYTVRTYDMALYTYTKFEES